MIWVPNQSSTVNIAYKALNILLYVWITGEYIQKCCIDKTRQDNVLFGVLYSPKYIDFNQII